MDTPSLTDAPDLSTPEASEVPHEGARAGARHGASTGQLLLRCARAVADGTARRAAEAHGSGLRPAHAALLPKVDVDGVRIVDLALRLGITKQAVSQTVGELVKTGVVEIAPDPDDGRAKRVRLTQHGADAVARELGAMATLEADLERNVGPKHMRALHAALTAIDEALTTLG